MPRRKSDPETPKKRGRPPCGVSRQERDRQRAATRRANRNAACLNILIPTELMARLKDMAKRAGKPVWRLSLEALEQLWIKDCAARGANADAAKEDAMKWRGDFEQGLKAARKNAEGK